MEYSFAKCSAQSLSPWSQLEISEFIGVSRHARLSVDIQPVLESSFAISSEWSRHVRIVPTSEDKDLWSWSSVLELQVGVKTGVLARSMKT